MYKLFLNTKKTNFVGYNIESKDYDGKYEDFDIVSVNRSMEEDFTVYPNPSNGEFQLAYYSKDSQMANIVVYDILGKPIYESTNTLKKGVNNISVNLNNPKNGVYILKTEVDGEVFTLKVTVR